MTTKKAVTVLFTVTRTVDCTVSSMSMPVKVPVCTINCETGRVDPRHVYNLRFMFTKDIRFGNMRNTSAEAIVYFNGSEPVDWPGANEVSEV